MFCCVTSHRMKLELPKTQREPCPSVLTFPFLFLFFEAGFLAELGTHQFSDISWPVSSRHLPISVFTGDGITYVLLCMAFARGFCWESKFKSSWLHSKCLSSLSYFLNHCRCVLSRNFVCATQIPQGMRGGGTSLRCGRKNLVWKAPVLLGVQSFSLRQF